MQKGQSETLVATINPDNTTNSKVLTWESSNPSVATVDQTGKINAIAAGTTTITVRTSNGKTATCNVTVTVPIESVSLNKTQLILDINTSQTLVATINPSDTTEDKTLSWKSSNSNVAKVDSNGNVTAVGGGSATITVTTSNGKTATCTVTVEIPITGIKLDKTSLSLGTVTGRDATLTVTLLPSNATEGTTLTWESSNSRIVSVTPTGDYTAKVSVETIVSVSDTATITVTSSEGYSATCRVTVSLIG